MLVIFFMSAVATPLVIMKLLAAARWSGKNNNFKFTRKNNNLTKTVCEIYMFEPVFSSSKMYAIAYCRDHCL